MLVRDQNQQQTSANDGNQSQQDDAVRAGDAAASSSSTRPEGLADQYWDGEKNETKLADLIRDHGELAKFKTEQDEAAGKLPKAETDYTAPEALFDAEALKSLPEGAGDLVIDTENPAFVAARKFALDNKLSNEQFQGLLKQHALGVIQATEGMRAQIKAEVAASIKALGANGPSREKAVIDALKAQFGEKAPGMGELDGDYIQIFEKLIEGAQKSNVVTFDNKRDRQSEAISDEDYEKMTPRERLEFARSAKAGG